MARNKRHWREVPWTPSPPSPTCEVRDAHSRPCDRPTTYCYPAMGGGYMALCDEHAGKHLSICVTYAAAQRGETPFHATERAPNARK